MNQRLRGLIPVGGKSTLYSCSYCLKDISASIRFRCADPACNIACSGEMEMKSDGYLATAYGLGIETNCNDQKRPFELCSDCYGAGVEMFPHFSHHSYRISDSLDMSLFASEWSIAEELLLLEGIERFGAGNWKAISEFIGPTKAARQCEEHYWEHYFGKHGYCLPVFTSEELENYNSSFNGLADKELLNKIPVNSTDRYNDGDDVCRDGDQKRESSDTSNKEKDRTPIGTELPGYMPLREDFEVEYENEAEALLADMDFNVDDHPSERELKLRVIKSYNSKLDERDMKKRFVIDRGLVDFKKQQSQDRRRSKEERELVARLRMFARYQSAAEHDALVDGLAKARRIRKHIYLYQHYRRMGIRTLENVRQYELQRKKREGEMKSRRQREVTPYLFDTGRQNATTNAAGFGLNSKDKNEEEGADMATLRGCDSTKAKVLVAIPEVEYSRAPHADLLGESELRFCYTSSLLPAQYLAAKDAIIREAFRNGTLSMDGIDRLLKITKKQKEHLFDFFVRSIGISANVH